MFVNDIIALPLACDRLCPAEHLFNPLADARADGIAGMARRAPVDGRAAALCVLCDMRHGTEFPQLHHKVRCVEALVAANRDASRRPILAGHALDHLQRRIPLGVTGGAGEFSIDHKAAAVLHENVADEAQLRALCSVDKSRFTLGRSSTAHKKPAPTSPSRSRSRFLEKVE